MKAIDYHDICFTLVTTAVLPSVEVPLDLVGLILVVQETKRSSTITEIIESSLPARFLSLPTLLAR